MTRRPRTPVPADVRARLEEAGVSADYKDRPSYQRNDYVSWIERSKRPETREKRIQQMLDELQAGGVYMKMDHGPSAKT